MPFQTKQNGFSWLVWSSFIAKYQALPSGKQTSLLKIAIYSWFTVNMVIFHSFFVCLAEGTHSPTKQNLPSAPRSLEKVLEVVEALHGLGTCAFFFQQFPGL